MNFIFFPYKKLNIDILVNHDELVSKLAELIARQVKYSPLGNPITTIGSGFNGYEGKIKDNKFKLFKKKAITLWLKRTMIIHGAIIMEGEIKPHSTKIVFREGYITILFQLLFFSACLYGWFRLPFIGETADFGVLFLLSAVILLFYGCWLYQFNKEFKCARQIIDQIVSRGSKDKEHNGVRPQH